MDLIHRILYNPKGGQFREFDGIATHLEPKDMALYRQLLPPQLALPKRPLVTIFMVDYVRVTPWPMSRYQEWSVLLKCDCKGEEGWFSLTMPVTKWVPMVGGRHIGFPKYVSDEITVRRSGEDIVAWGKHKGVKQIELEFHPGLTRPLTEWEKELLDDPSFFKGATIFLLVPPGVGPRLFKIWLDQVVVPQWSPCPGMVKAQVDPSENWAGLVPSGSSFAGASNHFVGGINIMFDSA